MHALTRSGTSDCGGSCGPRKVWFAQAQEAQREGALDDQRREEAQEELHDAVAQLPGHLEEAHAAASKVPQDAQVRPQLFWCRAAARLTIIFRRCAAMSSTRSRVVAATASTSRTALFPLSLSLLVVVLPLSLSCWEQLGRLGAVGAAKETIPGSIQQNLPSDPIPSSCGFGSPVRQNPLSPHLVADPCRDSGRHSADPARYAHVSMWREKYEQNRWHGPEDHAESVPTRRTSRSERVRVILHLLPLMLDECPTKGGESAQNEAAALVEIVRRILFDAGQSGSTARRGRVACCWRNCSRMAEHGMLRRKDGKDD